MKRFQRELSGSIHWVSRVALVVALLLISLTVYMGNWVGSSRIGQANPTEVEAADSQRGIVTQRITETVLEQADSAGSADDDVYESPLQNNLTRTLDQMIDSSGSVFGDSQDGLQQRLADADQRLTNIKLNNREAIRQANRQVRLTGVGPNVLLVVMEGVGKQDVGISGKLGTTPLLEGLAEQSLVAPDCYAGPTAEVARHMLLTGNGHSARSKRNNRLAESAWDAGYRTTLLTAGNWLSSGELAAFDDVVEAISSDLGGPPQVLRVNGADTRLLNNQNKTPDDDISGLNILLEHARQFLITSPTQRPRFVQLHLPVPTGTDEQRKTEIAAGDQALGRFVHAYESRRSSRPLVLVCVGLPNDQYQRQGDPLSEDWMQVPLMIYHSRQPEAETVSKPTGLLDVLPTLLDLMDAARRPRMAGSSLVRDANLQAGQRLFRWEDPTNRSRVAVRAGNWKAIFEPSGSTQLFQLEDDPQEQVNVADKHPEILATLGTYARVESTNHSVAEAN